MDTQTATTRRNLAQRIERFIAARRAGGPALTVEESTNLDVAIAALESGRYPEGEDAMMLAEKGWAPRGGAAGFPTMVDALAARLEELTRG